MGSRRVLLVLVLVFGAMAGMCKPALAWGPFPRGNYSHIVDGLYLGGWTAGLPPRTTAVLTLTSWRNPYQGAVHARMPIPDAPPAPDLAWLRSAVDWIDSQQRAGRITYVHCRAGRSRSAMVVTAYLMQRYHLSRDQALQFVREQRPVANPIPAFMTLLCEWERELQVQRTQPAQ